MFSEEKALVGSVDYNGIVQFARLLQVVEKASYAFIHRHGSSEIVPHVLLVFPSHQFVTAEFSAPVLGDTSCID